MKMAFAFAAFLLVCGILPYVWMLSAFLPMTIPFLLIGILFTISKII